MSSLKPFRGLRPPKEIAHVMSVPPYDVVNSEEARDYARGKAQSFFRISRPEVDLPPSIDEHAEEVYQLGLSNLKDFISRGWLEKEATPCFYIYRQVMGNHAQIGFVAAASVEEYDLGLIKKHELTRQDKEDDRTHHIETLGANDEPVFLTYREDVQIDGLISKGMQPQPAYDFVSEDNIRHTFWVVQEPLNQQLEQAFRRVPRLYIADGHHRSKAASRVLQLRKEKGLPVRGHDRFLAVIFPDVQMQILPYNRLVKDLKGLSKVAFLERLAEKFEVKPAEKKAPARLHDFGMYLDKTWYQLTAKPGSFENTPTQLLDVSILQENLLAPLLGISEPRTDKRIAFVGGIRGTVELEKQVDSGQFAVAFSLFPTQLRQVMDIADAGETMPPKSTWFEPKLRSGLVLHPFE